MFGRLARLRFGRVWHGFVLFGMAMPWFLVILWIFLTTFVSMSRYLRFSMAWHGLVRIHPTFLFLSVFLRGQTFPISLFPVAHWLDVSDLSIFQWSDASSVGQI